MVASLLFLLFLSLVIAAVVAAVATSFARPETAAIDSLISTDLCDHPNFAASAASHTPSKTSVGITRTNELAHTLANANHQHHPSTTNRTTIKLVKGGAITA